MAGGVKKPPDARRNELLDSAQALFFSKGCEATTITDIMESAGVSKGGFYHHFTAKEDLLEALGERLATETVGRDRTCQTADETNPLDMRGVNGWDVQKRNLLRLCRPKQRLPDVPEAPKQA